MIPPRLPWVYQSVYDSVLGESARRRGGCPDADLSGSSLRASLGLPRAMTRSFPTVNATAVTVTLSPTASASGMGALLTSRARLPSREAGASLRDRTPAPPRRPRPS